MTKKYVYFFRGDLKTHVGLYKAWVDAASNDIDIDMVTFLNNQTYKSQIELARKYSTEGVKIFHCSRFFVKFYTTMYFLYLSAIHDGVVVHCRKQSTTILDIVKKLTGGKLKYVVEVEGDADAELEYIENPDKSLYPHFYRKEIESLRKSVKENPVKLKKADAVIVPTKKMKDIYLSRYLDFDESDIYTLPTAFSSSRFYHSEKLRDSIRKVRGLEESTVIVFCGALHYSWQNIARSIDLFKRLKDGNVYPNLHFIILTRPQDFWIAIKFFSKFGVSKDSYTLESVPHEEVNGILNASDIGILLRENHLLNKVVSTGKVGEYLACGLPLITSKHVGFYSHYFLNDPYVFLFDDIYSEVELSKLTASNSLLATDEERKRRSEWAVKVFSAESQSRKYVNILKSLI